MHVIVGLADTAAAVLSEWEKVCSDLIITSPHAMVNKSEPDTIRLIRTACKAFSRHGSEKSKVYQHFTAFLMFHKILWHLFVVIVLILCFIMQEHSITLLH